MQVASVVGVPALGLAQDPLNQMQPLGVLTASWLVPHLAALVKSAQAARLGAVPPAWTAGAAWQSDCTATVSAVATAAVYVQPAGTDVEAGVAQVQPFVAVQLTEPRSAHVDVAVPVQVAAEANVLPHSQRFPAASTVPKQAASSAWAAEASQLASSPPPYLRHVPARWVNLQPVTRL